MDASPQSDGVSQSPSFNESDATTPDNSTTLIQTPTAVPQKRWNLRQRKTQSKNTSSGSQESVMNVRSIEESSTQSTTPSQAIESSLEHATPLSKVQKREVKRDDPKPQTVSAKRKAPEKRKYTVHTTTNSEAMFITVSTGKGALKNVASDWVDRYEADPESAMLELIQFLVLCCGCKAGVSEDMFKNDTTEAIRSLTENFAESSYEYPLIMAGPLQKKFKNNFCELIWRLVEQCQHSIIYDEYMLDTLIVWLVGFTDSQVRAFRHTSSLASIKLVSALITIASSVNTEMDNTQRQIEAERKRQATKKTEAGLARLELLFSKLKEVQAHKAELEDTMKGLFSSVFVHRYRDVRPEIRSLCITEIGVWLKTYSVKFLADSYLKYIGWMLFDKVGEVRLACLKVLEKLYSDSDTAPHMELFTERFKSRLLSMRLDIDDSAAVTAINVLSYMQSLDLLDTEECQEVCEQVFLEHRGISHAAGQFAVGYLFSDDFMSKAKKRKVPKGHTKPSESQIMLTELIKFFVEVKIHDHANYFVDSFWEYTDVLQDWEAMTQLLLDEKCGVQLTDVEEAVLIEMMACSVRKAIGDTPPTGRAKGKVLSTKERRAMEDTKQELSSHFMTTLPDLISKFGSSPPNATNLASIPQHFEVELFAENRLQKQLENLLTHLHQLITKHLEPEVLSECTKTFDCLMDQEFSLHSTSDLAFKQLTDELIESFKQYIADCDEQTLTDDKDEDCFGLAIATRRLLAVYKYIDISSYEFMDEMWKLLENGAKSKYSEKVMENVIGCVKYEVMWSMLELDQTTTPERDVLRKIRVKSINLFKNCQNLLLFASGPAQREAFVTFADLLLLFSRHLTRNPALASLVYEPDDHLQDSLQDYVMNHIVHCPEDADDVEPSSEEEALLMAEHLNDRRVQLAAYLKLAMYFAIDMRRVAPVWAQYITQYPNFGDLIKLSMNRCREKNPILWYKTVVICLTNCFKAHLQENGFVDQMSQDWMELKELAKKFALSMGFEPVKVRKPLVGIHREGILFAISGLDADPETDQFESADPPPNLDFLTILSEFSHRLLMVDRTGEKGVIPFLREHLPSGLLEAIFEKRLEGWGSLVTYYRATSSPQLGKGRGIAIQDTGTTRSVSQSRAKKRPLKVINESLLSDVSQLSKRSRIQATPTTNPGSEDSGEDESVASPPGKRQRRAIAQSEF